MPKESPSPRSCPTLIRKALEILRLVWSDRRQPCATTSQQTAPTGQIPGNDGPCTPRLQSISGHAVNEATQPRPGLARALNHQAAPRRAPERHDSLDRAPATTRPTAHPHAWHEPLPHLGSRGLATRAVRRSARPVDRLQRLAPRAPPPPSFSPLFAAVRRPTEYRGDWWCLVLALVILAVVSGFVGGACRL